MLNDTYKDPKRGYLQRTGRADSNDIIHWVAATVLQFIKKLTLILSSHSDFFAKRAILRRTPTQLTDFRL
jgi:hypothetical protein